MPWTAQDIPDQTGKTAIVTGANSGIGYETTRMLAAKGAHVIMACRNLEKAEEARRSLQAAIPEAKLTITPLDLADLSSVKAFAETVSTRYDQLHTLYNNAGVMALPERQTADGFEMQFGVNHLGHFALTGHLLALLQATTGSRVVAVSSLVHYVGRLHLNNPNLREHYGRYRAYFQSKLANVMFAFELQRRLEAAGQANPIAVAAHPGYCKTNLLTTATARSTFDRLFYGFFEAIMAQPAWKGALGQLRAGTAPDITPGAFYGPPAIFAGYPRAIKAIPRAYDQAAAARLWALSEELTGVHYPLISP